MKLYLPLCVIILFAIYFSSCSNPGNRANASTDPQNANLQGEDDIRFIKEAADGGRFEEEMGDYMRKNCLSADVKGLSQHMFEDHRKANEELKELAKKKGVELRDSLSERKKMIYEEIKVKSGVDMDKAYVNEMIEAHQKDIEFFKREAKLGTDPEVKAWAAGKISTLQHHLEMSQSTLELLEHQRPYK